MKIVNIIYGSKKVRVKELEVIFRVGSLSD